MELSEGIYSLLNYVKPHKPCRRYEEKILFFLDFTVLSSHTLRSSVNLALVCCVDRIREGEGACKSVCFSFLQCDSPVCQAFCFALAFGGQEKTPGLPFY